MTLAQSQSHFDVVVIGGGINGVGVAQAAAAAGHSVLLFEKHHLAAGTSSKSSKLIHGGLRYLESYNFRLVREALLERALLLRLAPGLVELQDFYVPLYRSTRRGAGLLRAGLSLYYLLSNLNPDARFASLPRRDWGELDGLRPDGLRAVFRYSDARTDDAGLTRAVMRSARSLGAELICPALFTRAQLTSAGAEVSYRVGQAEYTVRARVLVNAAGPWVEETAQLVAPRLPAVSIQLVQGTHIELPLEGDAFAGRRYYYLESPRDGRAVFVMPRNGRLTVGTTETRYRHHPDKVRPLATEEYYLLSVLRHYFPAFAHTRREDLYNSWTGLRVLPAGEGHAFHTSRETILQTDRPQRPRVLTIYGGKLTSYRVTAQKVLARIASALPERNPCADTGALPLEPD